MGTRLGSAGDTAEDEGVISLPDGPDPYPAYQALRQAGPVHRVEMPDGVPVWLVTRYRDVRAALANPALSNDPRYATAAFGAGEDAGDGRWRPENLHNMLRTDPPRHTRLRRLTASAFTARRVQRLRPRIIQVTDALLEKMACVTGPVDLIAGLAFPLPITVICELLGIPEQDRDQMREWTGAVLAYRVDEATVANAARAREMIHQYLTDLIAQRRRQPADDMVSELIAARDQHGGLTEIELLSTVSLLLTAGHETTVNLIGNGMLALLRHPQVLDAVRADPGLVAPMVEEMLRYDSPIVPGIMKFVAADTTIAGAPIPKGDIVLLAVGSANRDPEVFPRPEELIPDRSPNPHLSFGHGTHFCIGAALARMETEIALSGLLRRFQDIQLAVPWEQLTWRPSFIRGLTELPVHLVS